MVLVGWSPSVMPNADLSREYYHIRCFEMLIHLSAPEILPLVSIEPRALTASDAACPLDRGAEILVVEWKRRHQEVIDDSEKALEARNRQIAAMGNIPAPRPSLRFGEVDLAVNETGQASATPASSKGKRKAEDATDGEPSNAAMAPPARPAKVLRRGRGSGRARGRQSSFNLEAERVWTIFRYLPKRHEPLFDHPHALSMTLGMWGDRLVCVSSLMGLPIADLTS